MRSETDYEMRRWTGMVGKVAAVPDLVYSREELPEMACK